MLSFQHHWRQWLWSCGKPKILKMPYKCNLRSGASRFLGCVINTTSPEAVADGFGARQWQHWKHCLGCVHKAQPCSRRWVHPPPTLLKAPCCPHRAVPTEVSVGAAPHSAQRVSLRLVERTHSGKAQLLVYRHRKSYQQRKENKTLGVWDWVAETSSSLCARKQTQDVTIPKSQRVGVDWRTCTSQVQISNELYPARDRRETKGKYNVQCGISSSEISKDQYLLYVPYAPICNLFPL